MVEFYVHVQTAGVPLTYDFIMVSIPPPKRVPLPEGTWCSTEHLFPSDEISQENIRSLLALAPVRRGSGRTGGGTGSIRRIKG